MRMRLKSARIDSQLESLPKAKAAFIEPTQDSVVDKVFHLEFLDARIAHFHQPLNVAETFDRRKRSAFDAVDMTISHQAHPV